MLRTAVLSCLFVLIVLTVGSARQISARELEFTALKALEDQGAKVSVHIIDAQSGEVLADYRSLQPLIPASVTKLITAARALEVWGPEHRFDTRLVVDGQITNGTVSGDLRLVGGGDPFLRHEQLWALVQRAKAAGLRKVDGNLIVDASLFGELGCGRNKDRCDAQIHSAYAYDGPLSAASVDFATQSVLVFPPRGQEELGVALPYPLAREGLVVESQVKHGERTRLRLDRTTSEARERIVVSGQIPKGSAAVTRHVSVASAERQTGTLLQAFLDQAGIQLIGKVLVNFEPRGQFPESVELASVQSERLADLVSSTLTYSNNMMADTLALNLLTTDETVHRPYKVSGAGRALRERLLQYNPDSVALLYDGSGLDPENRMSARDLTALLKGVYEDTTIFPSFYGGLVVPEFSRKRSPLNLPREDWRQRLAVKTGGLSEPVTVATMAGYARLKDRRWLALALLVNGPRDEQLDRYAVFAAFEQDLRPLFASR